MDPVRVVRGSAVSVEGDNIDTDRMLPSRFLLKPRSADYAALLFHDLRFGSSAVPGFQIGDSRHASARILVAGINFGCGSAREQAVYGLLDFGIRALVAVSYGDIFRNNCVNNGLIPAEVTPAQAAELRARTRTMPETAYTLDLEAQTIADGAEWSIPFRIDPGHREQLLGGTDLIDLTTQHTRQIEAFEARYFGSMPWARFDSRALR